MFQTIETKNEFGSGKVISWASIIDENTIDQACMISRSPIVQGHIALMPDAHFGYGPPVGTAMITKDAIMPYAVGVDIGCGMIAARTNLKRGVFYGKENTIMGRIRELIPSGVGVNHKKELQSAHDFIEENDWPNGVINTLDLSNKQGYFYTQQDNIKNKILQQFGTLGAGNHFVEICEDYDRNVWFVIHSGSRGIGNMLATAHVALAQEYCREFDIALENKEFAYINSDDPWYENYILDMRWSQNYAYAQREAMMQSLSEAVREVIDFEILETINCHHNYAEEISSNVWLTRKGAIDASVGVKGIIPGSMGDATYIVEGLGNELSYNTSPHGAGRVLSRGKARKEVDKEEFLRVMQGKTWLDRDIDKLLDEAPAAYKSITTVMSDSVDLVKPLVQLQQFLNYKGL
jgi:tRNA-splicing ligase RtcB